MKRLALLLFALIGCSATEKVSPAPIADAGSDAEPPPVTPVTVKRTVITRNPFGGPPGNLLADGDFELSTVPQPGAQVGWRGIDATGAGFVNVLTETGGLCRSGLRCAVFSNGMVMFLRGASANQKGMVASIWAKPPAGGKCSVVRPVLIGCDTADVEKLFTHGANPDADGWCHYTAAVGQTLNPTCLYVDNTLAKGVTALLDSAMMGPDDGTVTPLQEEKLDDETHARIERARALIRASLPLGKRAPSREPGGR